MKTRNQAIVLSAGLVLCASVAWSQDDLYRLTEIGTLDGSPTSPAVINPKGHVAGTAIIDDQSVAFLWTGGEVKNLGNFGGTFNEVLDINSAGHVVGHAESAGGSFHAFHWNRNKLIDLGTLGGNESTAYSINGSGQVTGRADISVYDFHAFFWNGTTLQDIGTLGGSSSYGIAINNAGHITGQSETSDGALHAFFWNGQEMQDLGTLGGDFSAPFAINSSSQVAGWSETADGEHHAFFWDGTQMMDLGTLGGPSSQVLAMNNLGHATGVAQSVRGVYRAFYWDGTEMSGLGTLAGRRTVGIAINDSGQVIGTADITLDRQRPFYSNRGALMVDIDEIIDPSDPLRPCVTITQASDINNRGQIAAMGNNQCSGYTGGYLLTPLKYQVQFIGPATGSQWRRSDFIPVRIAINDRTGNRVSDAKAASLVVEPCRVKFSAEGAQPRSPVCMKYNATTDEFYFNWSPGVNAAIGTTNLIGAATYKFSMPERVTTSKSRAITITQ